MFCQHCGKEVSDQAVICVHCGCMVKPFNPAPPPPQYYQPAPQKSYASLVLGIIGIVFAWLFALVGHITSIIGIVLGVKEYKATGGVSGLVLSIIGEVCSIISSVLGVIIVNSYLY